MRLDRVLSEGEAQIALSRLGFSIGENPLRPGMYELSHPRLGGSRTVTSDQLVAFAEGATLADELGRGITSTAMP